MTNHLPPVSESDLSSPVQMHLPDNKLAQQLFGAQNAHLDALAARLGVHVVARGNHVTSKGERARDAKALLDIFYSRLVNGGHIESAEFERTLDKVVLAQDESRMRDVLSLASGFADFGIKTRKKRTETQGCKNQGSRGR